MCVKPFVRLRLRGLPCGSNAGGTADAEHSVSCVSSAHAGRLLTLRGTIARVGPVMMYEEKRLYQCTKCKRGCGSAQKHRGGIIARLRHALSCPCVLTSHRVSERWRASAQVLRQRCPRGRK